MKLELQNVIAGYGKKEVLHGITTTFTCGVYGILGSNGTGKSTLMNVLTDNLPLQAGKILWDGEAIDQMGARYRRILGYAPQQDGLYEDFRAELFLDYMAALKEVKKTDRRQEVERVLKCVHMQEYAKAKLGSFSGGMKQRIMVAQALLHTPELIILDEPTAGLDPKERIRIRNVVEELGTHAIVLLATHVVSDIESIAKSILVLKDGRLLDQGTPAELIARYAPGQSLEEVYLTIFQDEEAAI